MKFFDKFKLGKNKAEDNRTEEQKLGFENAKKLGQQSMKMWFRAVRNGGTGYLRKQLRKHPEKKQKVEEVKKEKKVSKFVGLKSRKERRAEVVRGESKFAPLYNGEAPYRGQSKKALKIQKNDDIYAAKQKARKGA